MNRSDFILVSSSDSGADSESETLPGYASEALPPPGGNRSDFILVSSSDSGTDAASESLSDSESEGLANAGGNRNRISFVKKFTKRDLRILYIPLWFIKRGKMQGWMTCLVKYEDKEETSQIVPLHRRKPPRERMHELNEEWQFFTSRNQLRAGKKYLIEFVPQNRRRIEYLRVSAY